MLIHEKTKVNIMMKAFVYSTMVQYSTVQWYSTVQYNGTVQWYSTVQYSTMWTFFLLYCVLRSYFKGINIYTVAPACPTLNIFCLIKKL